MAYDDRRPDCAAHRPTPSLWRKPAPGTMELGRCRGAHLGTPVSVFYGIDVSQHGQKTANPPAVTASPAPAAGVAPPAPETTTGQAAPPAAAETTGRGGTSPAAR